MSEEQSKEEIQKTIIPNKQKELEEWDKKLRSGEALEIVKKDFLRANKLTCDPDVYVRKFAEILYPKYIINHEDGTKMTEAEKAIQLEAVMSFGVENDASIVDSIEDNNRGMAIKIRRELIKEHSCETYSEKMMVDMIVSSYMRNITAARKLKNALNRDTTSDILNKFTSVLSQEIDRAQRHFLTSLTSLKQIKSPNLSVNVKTNNAFFGQNQQVNTAEDNKLTPNKNNDEIIDQQ
ncbi:MAG: hypothetical protein NTZ25_00185 [Candidatus Peregrinibacteria bacterium]|nr:hypothetical protein [Candidatus Peregrinibacteria bacterium]